MDCFNAAYLIPLQHLPPSWYLSCLHIENSMIWYNLVFIAKCRKAFAHYGGMVVYDILLWEATQCVRVRWELAPLYHPPRIQVPPTTTRHHPTLPPTEGPRHNSTPTGRYHLSPSSNKNPSHDWEILVRYLIRKTLEFFGLFIKGKGTP